ncbi:integrase arm-type DNA-binding domain-containing protein [Comamonadaceae bacterium G21597-S1]|nr:integrase arm-type DNA-binding domain-containing protein [Comamonadaceae bacterium G21597-S1]
MPKKANELGPLAVKALTRPGLHAVGGVAGLHLQVSASGARSWVLKATIGSRRREMGLGGYPDITLAGAREAARTARATIRAGVDPIDQARAVQSTLRAKNSNDVTFRDAAAKYIKAQQAGWKSDKHKQQWENTLATYADPVIGSLLVNDITPAHVLNILEPIWTKKTETASRVRSRIELVLDWAKGRGYRSGDNPAAWRGNLATQLPKATQIKVVAHHRALPAKHMHSFMMALRNREGMAARALEFVILTATRSGEVRGATWSEFDLQEKVWTIPATRMKAKREHRVPLSRSAIRVLENLPKQRDELVFAATEGKPLSDMTLTAVLRRMGVDVVPHGFRSTFRDWAGETTGYAREVIEHALAHGIKDKAEAAYARGTLFDKRRDLMTDWARFIDTAHATCDVHLTVNK